jgi:hypothetical protein
MLDEVNRGIGAIRTSRTRKARDERRAEEHGFHPPCASAPREMCFTSRSRWEMSGGIGAVSAGISEWLVLTVCGLLLLVVAFGAWKLVKLLIIAAKG